MDVIKVDQIKDIIKCLDKRRGEVRGAESDYTHGKAFAYGDAIILLTKLINKNLNFESHEQNTHTINPKRRPKGRA